MNLIDLTEDNAQAYYEVIPTPILNEIGRKYFRGMAGEDAGTDELYAVIIWELKNVEDEDAPTEAELLWFAAGNSEDGKEFLTEWEKRLQDDGVSRVFFELAELGETERTVLSEKDFLIKHAESRDIQVNMKELAALKLPKKRTPDYICSLSNLTFRQFKAGIMTSVFHGRYGLLEDLPFLPMERYDLELSSAVITDGKVSGLLLVHEIEEGIFCVELFFALQPDANINLLYMLTISIMAAVRYNQPDDTVILRRHSDAALRLTKKLFPQKKGAMVNKGEKKLYF